MEYTVKSESERLFESWLYGFDYINNQEEKIDKPMKDTLNHEPRDYIFFNKFGEDARVISNVNSFKDAINMLCEEIGLTFFVAYEIFKRGLNEFDENDIVGIVSSYNRFAGYFAYVIGKVYLVDKKIYDSEEK